MKFFKVNQFADRARAVGRVISVCGIKLKRKKVGLNQYVYQIDPERFTELREDISRARQHCPGNFYKTLVNIPKYLVSYVAQWAAGTPDRVRHIHSYVVRLQPHWAAIFHSFMVRMVNTLNALATDDHESA